MSTVRDAKDVVELFERLLLGLMDEEEDESQGNEVDASIEAENADSTHSLKHAGECQGEDGCPEVVSGHGPRHADLTVRQGEDLRRIHEGYGTLACEHVRDKDRVHCL